MILQKPYTDQEWLDFVAYCNNNGFIPVDKGDYYESEREIIPLDDLKSQTIYDLKTKRDIAEQVPVLTDKGLFDVDDKSLSRINGAITVLSLTHSTIDWTLADNTVVEVDENDLRNVIVALAQQSNFVHEKYRTLKEQVMACETTEDVEKVVW